MIDLTPGNTYTSDGSPGSIQTIHDTNVVDGNNDIIVIPPGQYHWTVQVFITKGCTIQGSTTVVGSGQAGGGTVTSNNAVVVFDNITLRGKGLINISSNPARFYRVTGITFANESLGVPGAGNGGTITLANTGPGNPSMNNRVDNCCFGSPDLTYRCPLQYAQIVVYNSFGVVDHCYFDDNLPPHNPNAGTICNPIFSNNTSLFNKVEGNGIWEVGPKYGTDQFLFFETNTVIKDSGNYAMWDTNTGGNLVIRYCWLQNTYNGGHGTEGAGQRGSRARESYNNTWNYTQPSVSSKCRGGTYLHHDNTYTGSTVTGGNNEMYRPYPARSLTPWGISDGTSPYDANVTDINVGSPTDKTQHRYVEGHVPYNFTPLWTTVDAQGFAHAEGVAGATGVIVDSQANFPTAGSGLVGWSVTNYATSPVDYGADGIGSYITSNTATTINYLYYSANDTGQHMVFNPGDPYQIHRVLVCSDVGGRGKTEPIHKNAQGINVLDRTNAQGFMNGAFEPIFSWNNVQAGVEVQLKEFNLQPCCKHGSVPSDALVTGNADVSLIDLGIGLGTATPAIVRNTYTAAINGTATGYVGPFQYPHPLVSNVVATTKICALSGNLDFGTVNVGDSSTATLVITNLGNTTFSVTNIVSSDPRFVPSATTGSVAGNGGILNITITFTPAASTAYTTTLTVTSGADNSPQTITATGTGNTPGTKVLAISPLSSAFGTVAQFSAHSEVVQLSNTGNQALTITSFTSNAAEVTLGQSSFTIQPGTSVNLGVTLVTDTMGSYSGSIVANGTFTGNTTHTYTFTVSNRQIYHKFYKG